MRRAVPGYASAHRPWMKKVARMPAPASTSRIRSAAPGGHQERSGCSASNVSATLPGSLTCRHLRRVDVRAGGPAGRQGESPCQELGGYDGRGGAEQSIERPDRDRHRVERRQPAGRDEEDGRAQLRELRGELLVEFGGLRLRGEDDRS